MRNCELQANFLRNEHVFHRTAIQNAGYAEVSRANRAHQAQLIRLRSKQLGCGI
jgi:hypothetical protein